MTLNTMWIKHITSERIGFNNIRVTMNILFSFNLIITVFIAIPYWFMYQKIHWDMFFLGILGSAICCCANVSMNIAFTTNGPAGPITAICAMSSPLLAIVMAIKDNKPLTPLELIGIICGMFGILLMTNHEFFEKYCLCCCISKKHKIKEIE